MQKYCKYCNVILTTENSVRCGKKSNGEPRFKNTCKPCRVKEASEWIKKNKEKFLLYQNKYQNQYNKSFQKEKRKLTSEDVLMIRKLKQEGMRTKDIALKFGIYPMRVSSIISRKAWKNI